MRVLVLHNRYQQYGGEDAVVHAEASLLKKHGHVVEVLEVANEGINGAWQKLQAAVSSVYSTSSYSRINKEVSYFRPDIVHIHNFFPLLSPAVYDACMSLGVPAVQTLHNYRLGCPNALLFRNGSICENCLGKDIPWPSIIHGCYRDSRIQTAAVASMLTIHRMRKTWQERVNAYIALNYFQRDKLVLAGLPKSKIHVKPNFTIDPGWHPIQPLGNYALYVGRLSVEKGIANLIEAYVRHGLRIPLKVVGDGPLGPQLYDQVIRAQLEGVVEFLGWQEKCEILKLMKEARFLVFPSVWYEPFGLSLVEAFACGIPAIASDIGGIPEILEDGRTGWLVHSNNTAAWAETLTQTWNNPAEIKKRGLEARSVYESRYSPEVAYENLISIYHRTIRSLDEQNAR